MFNLFNLVTFSAPSEKTGEYEPLKRDENTDSDDEEVNGIVLFEHTTVKTAKGKYKRLVPTLCFAVVMLAVFTVVLYFTSTKTLAKKPHFKKPHTQKPQPNKTLEVKERFMKTPEWTKTIEGFGMFLSPRRRVHLKPTRSSSQCFRVRYKRELKYCI